MRRVAVALLFAPVIVHGQEATSSIPDEVISQLAADLAELHEAVVSSHQQGSARDPSTVGFGVSSVMVTADRAPVRAGASDAADAIAVIEKGARLPVVDKAGEWYAVEYGPTEFGWLRAEEAVPTTLSAFSPTIAERSGVAERLFRNLAERASNLRDAYNDNPYISVSGFSIDVSLSPSLSISFEFRESEPEP